MTNETKTCECGHKKVYHVKGIGVCKICLGDARSIKSEICKKFKPQSQEKTHHQSEQGSAQGAKSRNARILNETPDTQSQDMVLTEGKL